MKAMKDDSELNLKILDAKIQAESDQLREDLNDAKSNWNSTLTNFTEQFGHQADDMSKLEKQLRSEIGLVQTEAGNEKDALKDIISSLDTKISNECSIFKDMNEISIHPLMFT